MTDDEHPSLSKMCAALERTYGPRNYAPHISDPDPPAPPMNRLQMKKAALLTRELMIRKGHLHPSIRLRRWS
jgi:hypothetical protein